MWNSRCLTRARPVQAHHSAAQSVHHSRGRWGWGVRAKCHRDLGGIAHCTWDLGWTAGRDFGAAYNCYRLFLAFRPRVHFLCTATKEVATLGSGLGSGRQVGSSQRVSNQGSFNTDWTWREREFSGKCSPVCLLLPFLTCVTHAECSLLHSPSCNAGWVAPQLQHQLENRNNVEVSRRHALCRCTSHLALCT